MTVLQSVLLGLLQGIAEFLPISSSGHLKIAQSLFGLEDVPVLFDVFLHLATLLAVVIFFRKKICDLVISFFCLFVPEKKLSEERLQSRGDDRKYIVAIIIATVITGAIGVFNSKLLDEKVFSVKSVCAGLLVTSGLLVVSSVYEKKQMASGKEFARIPGIIQSVVIGILQGFGTLPGISRSGSTISGALFCNISRESAGEFSFIVSIPAILGAFLLELKDLGEMNQAVGIAPLACGCITAFVAGYAALAWLMKLIKKGRLEFFACYLVPAGILGMLFLG
ncbi:MAG: undecaprenyl-diphosphate phosphatase [Treponema sp.]|nr:undecaprenyl-diphosphate phosphatase [Treponema sp.]